ncbi:MAG TPA: DNA recombination protein RmuC [Acidimicrobiia bacterium]|jgi:DNA recombination protein RmuC
MTGITIALIFVATLAVLAAVALGAVLARRPQQPGALAARPDDAPGTLGEAQVDTVDTVDTVQAIVDAAVDQMLDRQLSLLADERAQGNAEMRRAVEEVVGRTKTMFEGERTIGTTELDARKSMIDQSLQAINTRMAEFERTVHDIDGRSAQRLGALATSVASLNNTTEHLRDALANSRVRGQWGERMADDVLRLAGFVEGINYHRNRRIEAGTIPDYTFLLPGDLVMHMDVKFPLENYVHCLDADNDLERERHRRAFLTDVRARVKELTGRGYLSDQNSTVDCLLMFVPNEQVLGFVQEHDDALLEEALRNRIVICSPLTLFAVLRVVRQAVDNFRLERTANEILQLLGQFSDQWDKFGEKLDKLSRSFATAQKDLDEVRTTRSRALQRPLDRIAALRASVDELEAGESPSSGLPGPTLVLEA